MPRINLDELVPEDIEFEHRGHTYIVDGDLDVDTTFDLVDLFVRAGAAEEDGNLDEVRRSNRAIADRLLELFQRRDPSLERLPFGVQSYRVIVGQLIVALGLQIVDEAVVDPPKPRPKKTPVRSRRSSGSRR